MIKQQDYRYEIKYPLEKYEFVLFKSFLKSSSIFLSKQHDDRLVDSLYFDNIEPVDYSWAFFFYAVGLFLFKNKLFEFCIIFFGLAIGTRINFFLFIFFSILFFYDEEISLKKRLYIILSTLFVGCLFYLPIWYHSKFQFHWLTAGRPIEQGTIGLIYRFLYKSFYAFG